METFNDYLEFSAHFKIQKEAKVFLQNAVNISTQICCKYCPTYPNLEKQTNKQTNKKSKLTILRTTVSNRNRKSNYQQVFQQASAMARNMYLQLRQQGNLIVRKLASNYLNLS